MKTVRHGYRKEKRSSFKFETDFYMSRENDVKSTAVLRIVHTSIRYNIIWYVPTKLWHDQLYVLYAFGVKPIRSVSLVLCFIKQLDRVLYRYALSYSKVTASLEAYPGYAGHPHTTLTQGHPTPNSPYESLQRHLTSEQLRRSLGGDSDFT